MTKRAFSRSLIGLFCCGILGCADEATSDAPTPFIDGFSPAPVADGYTRYITPPIRDIEPGKDGIWCQYLTGALDEDVDVIDAMGEQSKGGHHLILYATSTLAPVGTTRECSESDMLSIRPLGGIGGEGAGAINDSLPKGVSFRVPKGYAIMANTHFVNASAQPIDGQGVVDLQQVPADPATLAAALLVNIDQNIAVPPHQTGSLEANCVLPQDFDIFLFGNHLHEAGTSVFSELIQPDGTKELLREDPVWHQELTFNPAFTKWPIDAPKRLKAGDTIHTHCEWTNTGNEELTFPREMCVSIAVFAGNEEIHCIDGVWPKN